MEKTGYTVNQNALNVIVQCEDWYSGRVIKDFHLRQNLNGVEQKVDGLNFAKRCCSDDANLCEVVSIAPEKESASQEFIDRILSDNRFDVRYREQLEKVSATGTAGAYIYLRDAEYLKDEAGDISVRGGDIMINYVDADCIIPLTVENKLVTECAFCATNTVKGKEKTTLVIFTKNKVGVKVLYSADTIVFDMFGKEETHSQIQLGEVKPFAIMTNAEVNSLDNMDGYGLPKVLNAIPMFKAVDLCYYILHGDLKKGDKIVFINELLAGIKMSEEGKAELQALQKELFILIGEKLPQEKTLIQEYNPVIRVDDVVKAFELVLSLLSMSFGYGTKKYTFENGQIKTATEYIGEKQDAMQELNKQRKQASAYISDIVHAAMWFSNQFSGTAYDVNEPLLIEFDDSYIEDRQSNLESMRADALSFPEVPILKVWYLMERYNLPEEEAKKYIQNADEPIDDIED